MFLKAAEDRHQKRRQKSKAAPAPSWALGPSRAETRAKHCVLCFSTSSVARKAWHCLARKESLPWTFLPHTTNLCGDETIKTYPGKDTQSSIRNRWRTHSRQEAHMHLHQERETGHIQGNLRHCFKTSNQQTLKVQAHHSTQTTLPHWGDCATPTSYTDGQPQEAQIL